MTMTALSNHRPEIRRAFTLLELLVVIAVIVLIVAITIPALGGARDIARATSTKTLMTDVSNAIGSFRTDNADRMPGFFSQVELGNSANDPAMVGLTAMENALIDLVGVNAIGQGIDQITIDINGQTVDLGLDLLGAGEGNYLDLDLGNFVAQGNVGGPTVAIEDDIPDLVDAFGQPILLWAEDTGAPDTPTDLVDVAGINSYSDRSRLYWQTNAAFLDAQFLGKDQASQFDESLLSSNNSDYIEALAAVTGDPGSPSPAVFTMPDELLPGKSRGTYMLHSAGRDGIFVDDDERGAGGLGLVFGANFFQDAATRLTDAPHPGWRRAAVIGAGFLVLQCAVLDALVWPRFFVVPG